MAKSSAHNEEDAVRFQLNTPHVADEEIDGEVIIINLASGNYYSLLEEATEIWQLLRTGMSFGETTAIITERYQDEAENVRAAIGRFVGELQREGLVIPSRETPEVATPATPGANPALRSQGSPTVERPVFTPPKLNVYIDMQKLMLLDPIHQVDETGWPSVNSEAH